MTYLDITEKKSLIKAYTTDTWGKYSSAWSCWVPSQRSNSASPRALRAEQHTQGINIRHGRDRIKNDLRQRVLLWLRYSEGSQTASLGDLCYSRKDKSWKVHMRSTRADKHSPIQTFWINAMAKCLDFRMPVPVSGYQMPAPIFPGAGPDPL